jgi:hypothetical protein
MSASPKVIDLKAYRERAESEQDTAINALWDQLLTLAEKAWTWRDAESAVALQECVDVLKRTVAEEWGTVETTALRDAVRMAIR